MTHEPTIVVTFDLTPDVMEHALPSIQYLTALQRRKGKGPIPPPPNIPAYGEERMPTEQARAMVPEEHEGISKVESGRPARRGRIPGLYAVVPNPTINPEVLPPSALAIYRAMQARVKKAATAASIAERLGMSSGTVGWALAELRKVGLVEYLPRAGKDE